jgi:hypothetical protein
MQVPLHTKEVLEIEKTQDSTKDVDAINEKSRSIIKFSTFKDLEDMRRLLHNKNCYSFSYGGMSNKCIIFDFFSNETQHSVYFV